MFEEIWLCASALDGLMRRPFARNQLVIAVPTLQTGRNVKYGENEVRGVFMLSRT